MRVPRLHRYYQDAPIPYHSFRVAPFPLLGDTTLAVGSIRVSRRHRLHSNEPGVGNPVSPSGNLPWKWQGLPSSWGTPMFICSCSSTPAGLAMLANGTSFVLLPLKRERKLRREFLFRGSIAWLLNSLSTLRSADYSGPTQDSLPTAG